MYKTILSWLGFVGALIEKVEEAEKDPVEMLITKLRLSTDNDEQSRALYELGKLKDSPAATKELIFQLENSTDINFREKAALHLIYNREPDGFILVALGQALRREDESINVKIIIAEALGLYADSQAHNKTAIFYLLETMNNAKYDKPQYYYLKKAASKSLTRFDPKQRMDIVEAILNFHAQHPSKQTGAYRETLQYLLEAIFQLHPLQSSHLTLVMRDSGCEKCAPKVFSARLPIIERVDRNGIRNDRSSEFIVLSKIGDAVKYKCEYSCCHNSILHQLSVSDILIGLTPEEIRENFPD